MEAYSAAVRPLPGVAATSRRQTLAKQMVASIRRQDYRDLIRTRPIDPARVNPGSPMFDPERAAVLHARAGRMDEAIWLVFLATHFGRHRNHHWVRVRDVYSGLGSGIWTWARVCSSPGAFRAWLDSHAGAISGGCGSHRKYESLVPTVTEARHTSASDEWTGQPRFVPTGGDSRFNDSGY